MIIPEQFALAFKSADGLIHVLPKHTHDKIEEVLRESSILSFQIDLPARLKKSLLANSPRIEDERSKGRYLLFDRNVTSEISALLHAEGGKAQNAQLAAAVIMMMLICKLTPAALTSLQEFESQFGDFEAYKDAVDFCSCLAIPFECHLALFEGKVTCLSKQDVPAGLLFDAYKASTESFRHATMWYVCYALVLKMVIVQRQPNTSGIEKFRLFLNWLHESLFHTPLFVLISSNFYSANRGKSFIKSFNSVDPEKLKRNLLNATWDLQILLEWHGKTRKAEFCILASKDNALKKMASRMALLRLA